LEILVLKECKPEADLENCQSSWHYAAHMLEPGLKPNPPLKLKVPVLKLNIFDLAVIYFYYLHRT